MPLKSMIKPRPLKPGDLVELVCPASPPVGPTILQQCAVAIQALGFKARLSPNAHKTNGFLAGEDADRCQDLMRAFTDPEVKAIFCVRGGYGSMRILKDLDFRVLAGHAKILVGYSDITALHCALWSRASMVSFHGPLTAGELVAASTPSWTIDSLKEMLMNPISGKRLVAAKQRFPGMEAYRSGAAEGFLAGGNLTLLAALAGTGFLPSMAGALLYLEEINEAPYRIDRYLTQLILSGALNGIHGILLGQFTGCTDPRAREESPSRQSTEDVLKERLSKFNVPIMAGLPFGHVPGNITLPFGIPARMDTETLRLELLEPAVLES